MSTPDPLKNAAATVIQDAQKAAAEIPVVETAVLSFRAKAVAYVAANAGKIVTGAMAVVALALWKFL